MLLNVERASKVMDRNGFDVLVASTKGNVAYSTDYWPAVPLQPGSHQTFSIIPRDRSGSAALVIPIGDLSPWLYRKSWVREVFPYGTYYVESFGRLRGDEEQFRRAELDALKYRPSPPNALEALAAAIRHKGLSRSRVGVDEMGIAPQHIEWLRTEFPNADIVLASDMFREIRLIKTPDEIERIRASTAISENAVRETCRHAAEGMTEKELANMLMSAIGEQGGMPAACYVGCGTKSAFTDRDPANHRVAKGDWIMFDLGCSYEHYYSDVGRSVVVGEPSDKQLSYYEAIRKGRDEAIGIIKPGVAAREIFRVAIESIRAHGIPHFRRHSVGHSIGVEPYDPPAIAPDSAAVIEEGMVLNIETPYYELGFGGIQLEDTYLVTQLGVKRISTLPQELQSVG